MDNRGTGQHRPILCLLQLTHQLGRYFPVKVWVNNFNYTWWKVLVIKFMMITNIIITKECRKFDTISPQNIACIISPSGTNNSIPAHQVISLSLSVIDLMQMIDITSLPIVITLNTLHGSNLSSTTNCSQPITCSMRGNIHDKFVWHLFMQHFSVTVVVP